MIGSQPGKRQGHLGNSGDSGDNQEFVGRLPMKMDDFL